MLQKQVLLGLIDNQETFFPLLGTYTKSNISLENIKAYSQCFLEYKLNIKG